MGLYPLQHDLEIEAVSMKRSLTQNYFTEALGQVGNLGMSILQAVVDSGRDLA